MSDIGFEKWWDYPATHGEDEWWENKEYKPLCRDAWQAAMKEKLPCGHPAACEIEHPDADGRYEGTRKVECGWCADKEKQGFNEVALPYHVREEFAKKHPQPITLEGPHWDEVCSASRAESNYAKCFTDLRSAVRELQSGINSINGKVGS